MKLKIRVIYRIVYIHCTERVHDFYGRIRVPRISGNLSACADCVYQALHSPLTMESLGSRLTACSTGVWPTGTGSKFTTFVSACESWAATMQRTKQELQGVSLRVYLHFSCYLLHYAYLVWIMSS